jgi:hypothetical protein
MADTPVVDSSPISVYAGGARWMIPLRQDESFSG